MVTLAITGGIACGKSLVGQYLHEMGIAVCDADDVGHGLLAERGNIYDAVVDAFGHGILCPDGAIDRRALGGVVFSDPRSLARLNALMHPEIMRRLRQWVSSRPSGTGYAAVVVPLLHEVGDEEHWDVVACVAATASEQLRRLGDRGMSPAEALARIRSQWTQAEKMERSDYVIYNCGSKELLREQTERMMRSIRGERT